MRQFTVNSAESGQKCIKYCEKILPGAGTGFLHKMLRKKNITLNGKKTDGSERLRAGDVVQIFFSEETFEKFAGKTDTAKQAASCAKTSNAKIPVLKSEHIIYEDEHVLFYNKPVGMLSQKTKPEDISLNEMLVAYVEKQNAQEKTKMIPSENESSAAIQSVSKASICNRLDRNTSGIVVCGKTYLGLRVMNAMIADRSVGKYYQCLVFGSVSEPILLKGYLRKDEKTNKVTVRKTEFEGASYIETEIRPLKAGKDVSLLEVHLITGKTHQIRSHLASLGHAILGDYKYGQKEMNDRYKQTYGLKSQLLHAYRIELPVMEDELVQLSEKVFIAPKPALFARIEKEELHGHVEF